MTGPVPVCVSVPVDRVCARVEVPSAVVKTLCARSGHLHAGSAQCHVMIDFSSVMHYIVLLHNSVLFMLDNTVIFK